MNIIVFELVLPLEEKIQLKFKPHAKDQGYAFKMETIKPSRWCIPVIAA